MDGSNPLPSPTLLSPPTHTNMEEKIFTKKFSSTLGLCTVDGMMYFCASAILY